ncbi:MAG: DNA topoisomerase I [Candidatus Thorarchaeota archaeon]
MSKVLIVSEKPSAARRIAEALDDQGTPEEVKKRGASYYECQRNNDTLIVVYALGHLFELKQIEKGWTYPRLEMEWVPKYEVQKKATNIKPIINLIKRLSKDVDSFVVATDYDIEGSLIGYLTLKYACKTDPKRAQRMVFSNLTKPELQSSYENMASHLDFPLIEAGQLRHEVDWLYGINFTRALTLAIKNTVGWFKIVSTGRVQGPTLAFVAERNRQINVFVPIPYWQILAHGEHDGQELLLEYSKKRLDVKRDAESIVSDLIGKSGQVNSINKRKTIHSPPVPFNLSGLQAEAYRHFGFKPSRTLALAQKLYLEALISYPRTSSQKIPDSIDTRDIIQKLGTSRIYKKLTETLLAKEKLIPVQGKKTDPAHPSIHPTGNKPAKLTPSEKKLYDLIVRRFLALFSDPSVKESIRADITSDEHLFHLRGLRVLIPGWMEYYGPYATSKERELPPLKEGDLIPLTSVSADEKYTAPPHHFNPASLLKTLEKANLGTKATRSRIVDSLKSRGYTHSDKFEISTLGYAALDTLEEYMPMMLSVEFTRSLEEEMDKIQKEGKKREEVLATVRESLLELLDEFRKQEDLIGHALVAGLQRYWKEKQELGPCPKCGDGTLIVIRSPKSGKRFIGCTNYKEGNCDQTYPLPQKGDITPLEKECEYCSHRMYKVVSGRRAWETCINWAECPGRAEDLKVLEERKKKRSKKASEEDDSSA